MAETIENTVDFSNVTFADFGKLSVAQKIGFLIFLPIALPVFVVVKVCSFLGINANQDHSTGTSSVGPEAGAAASAIFSALVAAETNDDQDKHREVGDDQWCNDLVSYGEEVASMRAATD